MTALPAPKRPEIRTCRILHLEDSPLDAELVAAHLERSALACRIHLVATRDAYAAALAAGGFDLILADYVIPGFDGLEALTMARELAPKAPFIFLSGTLGEDAAVEAVRAGATDYVVKARLARLPVAVERALSEARARSGQRDALVALRESEARLRLALDAGRLGAWELDLRGFALNASPTFLANVGRPPGSPFTYEDLLAAVHPDDRRRRHMAMARSIAECADYDVEYRVVWPGGAIRWVQVRGRPICAPDGTPLGMAGVSLDVTDRKLAEERKLLLSREVDHRAKNALAVVLSMLRLTRAADLPAYVRAVEARVGALARAQELLAEGRWTGADLRAVLRGELAPFLGNGAQVALDGPDVWLPTRATQPLTMALHELATNAVKYGALSVAEGRLSVTWSVEREPAGPALLRICWTESDGPAIEHPPARRGFGWRVLDATVRSQLGGAVCLAWEPAGLVCRIEMPLGAEVAPATGQDLGDA